MMLRLVAVAAAAAALAPLPTRPPVGARAVTKKAMSVSGGEVAKAPEAPWAVAGACAGAVLFGYHLGVVNTPLDAMSRTLGFAGDAKVAGAVVSSTLVGATAGSLLGGAIIYVAPAAMHLASSEGGGGGRLADVALVVYGVAQMTVGTAVSVRHATRS